MEQLENIELTKDQMIQELLALLNQSQQKKAANDVYEMLTFIDGMGKKLDHVTEELISVRKQLEQMEQEKANKSLKVVLKKSVDSLEQQCNKMKEQLFEIKTAVKQKAFEIVAETKAKGKAALNRVSEFLGIKEKLEVMRGNIRDSITKTEQTIARIDAFGMGMREAGQKIINTFRTFANKETVDYSAKKQKFSKTELVKKPFEVKKKLFEGMERNLDAAIDKAEKLAEDVELYKRKDIKQNMTDNVISMSLVAETSEYQYGAEVFEAAMKDRSDAMVKIVANQAEIGKEVRGKAR